MADNISLLAVFPDLEPAADAIEQLRALGLSDDHMNVISGIPVTEAMLGRPSQWTNVPRLARGRSGISFWSCFLTVLCLLYRIQFRLDPSLRPGPPTVVVLFEIPCRYVFPLPRRISR